ncbi:MAG: glycosyltransferase, partial [Actinomycetota bacterium]
GKEKARATLADRVGWRAEKVPTVAMVTRLVDQKGVDLAFSAARFLEGMRARLVVLGSGERRLADWGHWLARRHPDRVWFHEGYDVPLSHQIVAGADLLLMPSRFEPCGLAQMQAMAYGTIPVVTGVGGLRDTVIDADRSRDGNGFVAEQVEVVDVVDALHRAVVAWRHPGRRRRLMTRGMAADWSWDEPARRCSSLYAEVLTARLAARG